MKLNSVRLIKIGAVAYVLWGVLHLFVGLAAVFKYFTGGPIAMLQLYGSGLDPNSIADPGRFVANLIAHHSVNLLLFGALGIVIAVTLIWKQQLLGFWLNLIILGITDIAFVFALLLPGYIHPRDGIMGPVLYVIAALFTALGFYAPLPRATRSAAAA